MPGFGFVFRLVVGLGVPRRFGNIAAWLLIGVVGLLILWAAISAYNSKVINDWVDGWNDDFVEQQEEATRKAEAESERRRDDLADEIKTTEELIDEAISKGCAVGDYLATDGAECVRG